MSETSRGERWLKAQQRRGAAVWKNAASDATSGWPDYTVVDELGVRLVEAKLLQQRGSAFVPSQATRAQRWTLKQIATHGGLCSVLVLGPDRWLEVPVIDRVRRITRKDFDAMAQGY